MMRAFSRVSVLALLSSALPASVVGVHAADAPMHLVEAVKAGNRDMIRALLKQPAELSIAELVVSGLSSLTLMALDELCARETQATEAPARIG